MTFFGSAIFYVLIGASVAVAVLLSDRNASIAANVMQSIFAVLFWPLYLPGLLHQSRAFESGRKSNTTNEPLIDNMAVAICQVESELQAALTSLNGWAGDVLAGQFDRFDELKTAWRTQADRIREIDALLAQPGFAQESDAGANSKPHVDAAEGNRINHCETARSENLQRLRAIRRKLHDDLFATLAWVRELVTMIHLAKFTGAPASRAEELASQIAAAIEGLTEASQWRDQLPEPPTHIVQRKACEITHLAMESREPSLLGRH